MAKYYISVLLFRLVLPGALILSMALRPFGVSVLYLLLYLWLPLVQMPDSKTFSGWRGKIILVNFLVSLVLLLLHIAWHTFLAVAMPPYGSVVTACTDLQSIAQNLGFIPLDIANPIRLVQLLAPELVMTFTSLATYIIMKRLLTGDPSTLGSPRDSKHQQYPFLTNAGKYISLFLIMFSGILRPSATSGIYFLTFIGAATAWSIGKELSRGYAVVGRCLMGIMAAHIAALFAFQCSYLTPYLPQDNIYERIFGFTKLVVIDCKNVVDIPYVDHEWPTFASPVIILLTYYVLALETRELFKPKTKKKLSTFGKLEAGKLNGSLIRGMSIRKLSSKRTTQDRWRTATKKVRLIRGISPTKRLSVKRSTPNMRGLHQDSTGSVIVPDEDSMEEGEPPGLMEDIVLAIIGFFQVLIRSSYIATSITMMAWSIMYHSWLTFVFLMWANIVWLRQDQRTFMLKTSPVLVCYAIFLLLSQYIYGMDLNDKELPSSVEGVNLGQIGFTRPPAEPCMPLLIKSLFTCMFWITLRQRVQEAQQRKQSSTIADMVAPLQLTVSTAASVIEQEKEEFQQSRLLVKIGELLKSFCTRFWIYVVVIMLFIIGITGERMTIFRILYMFLFLAFILLFQISWRLWRRLMYAFWIVLIVYSMINLVLVYIYQFDNFPQTIENYLAVPVQLQYDLGLEKFKTADLFVRLLTPTCFLVITIMQVHYFHKDFLEISKLKSRTSSMAPKDESRRRSQSGVSTIRDDLPGLSSEEELPPKNRSTLGLEQDSAIEQSIEMSSIHRRRSTYRRLSRMGDKSYAPTLTEHTSIGFRDCVYAFWNTANRIYGSCRDLVFLYLEIHLIKIIFLALMLLSVLNVCALHVPIMLMISPGLLLNTKRQKLFCILISVLISIFLMAKMIYQIKYIPHSLFDVNCTFTWFGEGGSNETVTNTTTYNNAEWVGFIKVTPDKSLSKILKGYISCIALFTFHSMVMYRQQRFRSFGLSGPNKDKIMFPDVTRKEADSDLIHCLKYLVNYGFYKFGVEVTLICLIGVIGSRMDLYAVLYACWLLALVSMTRKRQACVWPAFTGFVMVLVPLQYMLAVGFLPQFCLQYPWSGNDYERARHWLFLPYADSPPHATKIIFDYFLLLFCARQRRVFYLERQFGEGYQGGSNSEDVARDWETPTFVNPVPDFLSYVQSWLDVIKRLIFLGLLWVTLAIMFLTGTNRVNLFSMGYLIGSFVFLWQGTDFYLRPKQSVLRWWSWLLRYNVCVVCTKTLLQIPGCMFNTLLQDHACWLVQLLGIGCVDKFAGGSLHTFIKMKKSITDSPCAVPQEDIGLAWDGVCFAFLLLQRRFFHSYYFYRVIDESKATTILASRGAELIEELRQKQMRQQENQESKILEKIKVKMERIKANQKKIQGPAYPEARHHDGEDDDEETHAGESDRAPLVHGDSETSARGYHTPESAGSPRGFHTPVSDESRATTPAPSSPVLSSPVKKSPPVGWTIPPVQSQIPPGPPSPSSALMTVSLDAYLEPQRLSFSSPPASELMPRAQSPEESYPVFSPPLPRRRHTVASPQPRTSVISYSSRSPSCSHHKCDGQTSGPIRRRVFTNRAQESTYRPRREPTSHQRAIRSGDYYMFDEFDDVDNDITSLKADSEESSDEDLPKDMGIGKLLSHAINTGVKRAVSLRRASAPAVRAERHLSVGSDLTYPRGFHRQPSKHDDVTHPAMVDVMLPETSFKEEDLSELGVEPPEEETWIDKIRHYMQIAWAFIESLLVSLTRHLMKYSRDYRYVSKALYAEKKVLKEKEGFGIGIREGSQMIWEPLPDVLVLPRLDNSPVSFPASLRNLVPPNVCRKLSEISVPEIRILAPSMERGLDLRTPEVRRRIGPPARAQPDTDSDSDSDSDSSDKRSVSHRHDSVYSLPSSESKEATTLEDAEDSMFQKERSPIVHLVCALWYAILSHTDIVCYLMVFINQIQSATILSIPLPLMVFLWGTLTIPRPTKTFWVTLIAYTEVIVLIKSMFQFEILPWNMKVIPDNMPFTAPRVIGIERKSNYALYDLLLLLIIFLHRFMLKSLGLWKESAPEIELREDAFYNLGPEETKMIMEGQADEVGRMYADKHTKIGGCHWFIDPHYHVHTTIKEAMDTLETTCSDPRVAMYVWERLQESEARTTRQGFFGSTLERLKKRYTRLWERIKRQTKVQDEYVLPEEDENKSADYEDTDKQKSDSSGAGPQDDPGPSKELATLKDPLSSVEAGSSKDPEILGSEPPKEPDDDHYTVNDEKEPIIGVSTALEDPSSRFPTVIKLAVKRYLSPVHQFFVRMLDPTARVTADVYAYMFMCDFFNFLVVIFGFAAFGTHQGDGGVQAYLEENKVPIPFLVMLILQFALIIIDRALYLRKFILGKILFQYALIIGVHVWMFFVLPFITERTFNTLLPPPMWYMVKCIYLLLSAYQIRCGYPRRIIGNFLCKGYNYINMFLFRGFMAVPFVFELRTLMDWIWTDTSMTLMDWLKMEDIFANVFLLKCSRYVEDEFPQPRGTKKANMSKYLMGGTVLAFIIAIIWFPLVLFAFGNTVGKSNPPTDVTVKIRIGPFLPAYKMLAQSHNIDVFTQQEYDQLSNLYAKDRTAQTFLSNYMYDDVAVITLNPDSTNVWAISPPELTRLSQEVASNATLSVKMTFVILHLTNSADNPPTIEDHREVQLKPYINNTRNPERETLLKMLNGKGTSDDWVHVKGLLPKFLKVFNKGTAKPAYQLIDSPTDNMDEMMYRDVKMQLESTNDSRVRYWRMQEDCENDIKYNAILKLIAKNDCDKLVMYTFNDKLFPETLNFISGSGIIGLYTTFVFLASRILRGFFSGIYTKIMFEDLPNVDRVVQMCLDIYLVREALELTLEEDLFAKLVFLYRSPETMIKWTRPKDEPEERIEPPPN